jgi:hypothetical protein
MKAEIDVELAVPPPPSERDGFADDAATSITFGFIKWLTADLHTHSFAQDLYGRKPISYSKIFILPHPKLRPSSPTLATKTRQLQKANISL